MRPFTCLALSSSSSAGVVALRDLAGTLCSRSLSAGRSTDAELLERVDELLQECGMSSRELRAVGVDLGPGAFAGTRVAVATAKGLAWSLGLPLVAATSLRARIEPWRALPPGSRGNAVLVIVNALRGEHYVALFDAHGEPLVPPSLVSEEQLPSWQSQTRAAHAQLEPIDTWIDPPLTSEGLLVTLESELALGRFQDPRALEPTYVRLPHAVPYSGDNRQVSLLDG